MQPQLCARCGKNPAVVFVTKFDGRESKNEGLCLKCAKQLGIKPIDDIFEKMGIAEEDLDSIQEEMTGALGELGNLASMFGGGLPEGMGGDLYLINGNMLPLNMAGAYAEKGGDSQ